MGVEGGRVAIEGHAVPMTAEFVEQHLLPEPGDVVVRREGSAAEMIWLGLNENAKQPFAFTARLVDRASGQWLDVVGGEEVICTGEKVSAAEMAALLTATEDGHRQRIEDLVYAAHQWADEEELCGRFDEFMEQNGLPKRDRRFTVRVEFFVEVEADSMHKAQRSCTVPEVIRHLQRGAFEDFTVHV